MMADPVAMGPSGQPRRPEQGLETKESCNQLKYPDAPLSQAKVEMDQDLSVQISPGSVGENTYPLQAPERDDPSLPPDEEEGMFRALKAIFEETKEEESGDLGQLMASLELAEKENAPGQHNIELLEGVRAKIYQLWKCRSSYMVRATELLANGSRDREFLLFNSDKYERVC